MRNIPLPVIVVLLFGLYVFNAMNHPIINWSFSEDEKREVPIYIEWKINNKAMYDKIDEVHTKFIINKKDEVVELKEEKSDFIQEVKVENETKFSIDSLKSFEIIMKNYYKNDIEKAFKIKEKFDKLEALYYQKKITHNKISNYSVGLAIFLMIVIWFRRRG